MSGRLRMSTILNNHEDGKAVLGTILHELVHLYIFNLDCIGEYMIGDHSDLWQLLALHVETLTEEIGLDVNLCRESSIVSDLEGWSSYELRDSMLQERFDEETRKWFRDRVEPPEPESETEDEGEYLKERHQPDEYADYQKFLQLRFDGKDCTSFCNQYEALYQRLQYLVGERQAIYGLFTALSTCPAL